MKEHREQAAKAAQAEVVVVLVAHRYGWVPPEADLALARKQAERKGLPYQTYIKSLLHETLIEREKRRVGW